MRKSFCLISTMFLAIMIFASPALTVNADSEVVSSSSYLYDSERNVIAAPESYIYKETITAEKIGTDEFGELVDITKDTSGNLYFLDKKNAKITVIDKNFKLLRVISEFVKDGVTEGFNSPSGIAVSKYGNIYIADTGNGRIVVLDENGGFLKEIGAPDRKESQYENEYRPSKVEVDKSERIYVIAENQTQGIFSFNSEGIFTGYVGAAKVTPSFTELFFRAFASKAQKKASLQFVPTEYSNFAMDEENFLFCVISAVDSEKLLNDIQSKKGTVDPVRRLNQDGTDITIKNGTYPPVGELLFDPYIYGSNAGASDFVDVATVEGGFYSVLDSKRGRVFTYDGQGNLLYIFGSRGGGNGQFEQACSLIYSEENILVADRKRNTVQVFSPTNYSTLIRNAVLSYNSGEYEAEYKYWKEVISLYSGSEIAYSGVGRYHYNNEDYKEAMNCFKMANNRKYYSLAVKKYIAIVGKTVTPYAVSIITAAVVFYSVYKSRRDKHKKNEKTIKYPGLKKFASQISYSKYISFHPFDGFWDLKHEKRGGAASATVLLLFATLANTVSIRFKSFTFNTFDYESNSALLNGIEGIVVIVLLWCVANWSMTTLMDGKGTMKDIYCYACYSLLPVIIVLPVSTVLSYILPIESAALLNIITTIAFVWTGFLIFCGTSATHDYSAGKTVVTILLTVVGMLIILFLFVLTITLIQQIIAFVSLLVKEISMRT